MLIGINGDIDYRGFAVWPLDGSFVRTSIANLWHITDAVRPPPQRKKKRVFLAASLP